MDTDIRSGWADAYLAAAPQGDLFADASPDMAAHWRTMLDRLSSQAKGDPATLADHVARQAAGRRAEGGDIAGVVRDAHRRAQAANRRDPDALVDDQIARLGAGRQRENRSGGGDKANGSMHISVVSLTRSSIERVKLVPAPSGARAEWLDTGL